MAVIPLPLRRQFPYKVPNGIYSRGEILLVGSPGTSAGLEGMVAVFNPCKVYLARKFVVLHFAALTETIARPLYDERRGAQ